jgi:Sulfite exporter TauE/SafE
LLFLFALAMIAVGVAMLRPRAAAGNADVRITAWMAVRLTAIGLVVGAVSGFFGIGGGFLIVPGLMLATGMPILNAIGSSRTEVDAQDLALIAQDDRFEHALPAVGAVNVAGTQDAALQVAELVEHEQRVVAGALVMTVPDAPNRGTRRACRISLLGYRIPYYSGAVRKA